MITERQSFAQRVGEEHVPRLIELFLQNERYKSPTIREIIGLMPEAKFTMGRLVAIRRDYEEDIARSSAGYLALYGEVPPPGQSNLTSSPDPRRIKLLRLSAHFNADQMPPAKPDALSQVRRKAAWNLVFGNGEIGDASLKRVIKRLGIAAFLQSEGIPQDIAEAAEELWKHPTDQ